MVLVKKFSNPSIKIYPDFFFFFLGGGGGGLGNPYSMEATRGIIVSTSAFLACH